MYVKIKNENYGYAVATYGDYVVVSNPSGFRLSDLSMTASYTGSLDYFRYNRNTDEHDYINTLYKTPVTVSVLLSTEDAGSVLAFTPLHTELAGPTGTRNRDIEIDKNNYTSSVEDGFGISLDMYNKYLVVGCPYYNELVMTSASAITASGAAVEVHYLGLTEYLASSASTFIFNIEDPDINLSTWTPDSFGYGVSINQDWVAVGSPKVSGSNGMVYMYFNQTTGSNYKWTLYQKIEATGSMAGALFGSDLKLNKISSSASSSLVVGCGNPLNGEAYYFEYITGSWRQTFTFKPDYSVQPLTFGGYQPYLPTMNVTNGFGAAVSTYGDAVIVGEYADRTVYEYSGSPDFQQGSVYVFEKCPSGGPMETTAPRFHTSSIDWTVGGGYEGQLIKKSLTSSTELSPHAVAKVNNKLYCGGWSGKIYVLTNPDVDIDQFIVTNCRAGGSISDVCYSDVTGFLYFINGPGGVSGTGSIIKVNPNNISDQYLLVQGLAGGSTNLFNFPVLAPICTYGNYLYMAEGGYNPSTFKKIDIHTGNVVLAVPWISASATVAGAHACVMDPSGEYFYVTTFGNKVAKVSTTDLSHISRQIFTVYPSGPSAASLTDDIAYLDGYIYASVEVGGNIFKIDTDDLSYTSSPVSFNSWGVFTDGEHIYLLAGREVWIYPNGDLDNGPIRFTLGAVTSGCAVNELWFTDGGKFVFTEFVSAGSPTGKVIAYNLPWHWLVQPPSRFQQVFKTYGNEDILKNNLLGFSVDMYGYNAVAGIPKINTSGSIGSPETTVTSCYVGGTLEQLHQCNSDLENLLNGQAMLLQKNTSSGEWGITNIYQKKKSFLSPYRSFGFDVSIADKSMVVGAPVYMSDSNRDINITTTQSAGMTLDDVSGKAYIYNLKNLRDTFHIGNVFYRNGKIVIMTSGSVFDGLFFNPVNTATYEYDLQFKGQHEILEKQIVCSVNPGEFNVSTNPTSLVPSTASFDINGNGVFDFQDADIILKYMQYKNTSVLGVPVTTDWSSSIVVTDDEISLLNYYQSTIDSAHTDFHASQSILKWETVDTGMQDILDLNEDNKIDIRDMNIMWKYFTNRLTQENYSFYITPSCRRTLFSDIMDYMNRLSQRTSKPQINPYFSDYERLTATDKTGSFLAPYVTTIGLYSGLDLVAVAKLGTPIKITPELPINFVVKMDF